VKGRSVLVMVGCPFLIPWISSHRMRTKPRAHTVIVNSCVILVRDHHIKVKEVLVRVWTRLERGLGEALGSSRGLGWGKSCWGRGDLGVIHLHG